MTPRGAAGSVRRVSSLSRRSFLGRAAGVGGVLLTSGLVSTPARAAGLPTALLDELQRAVRGPVYRWGTTSYVTAAALYNERFDAVLPGAIVRPVDAADVQATLAWAARHGIPVVPRGGGHSYPGNSTTGLGGVVIDLRYLRRIEVSGDATRARLGGGVLAIDAINALAARGTSIPTGSCPSVGVTGLALGGGIGLTSRAHGLTCDRIESVEIVTADGELRTATPDADAELLWASQGGGGGNFGIVTSMVLRTEPLTAETTVRIQYPWAVAGEVLSSYLALMASAPRALTADLALSKGWEAKDPVVTVDALFLGDVASTRAALAPLLELRGASVDLRASDRVTTALQFGECSGRTVPQCRPARFGSGGTLQRSRFFASSVVAPQVPSAEAQRLLLALSAGARPWPTGRRLILIAGLGGAIDDVPPGATAYPHRGAPHLIQVLARSGGSWEDADARRWAGTTRAAIARSLGSTAAYVNYLDPDQPSPAAAYYGASLPRLQAAKAAYDPQRRFAPRGGVPLPA